MAVAVPMKVPPWVPPLAVEVAGAMTQRGQLREKALVKGKNLRGVR